MSSNVPNLVIAGVNKAGTTSLFSALARHPEVASSDVKETCFFLPLRYAEPQPPIERYGDHFRGSEGAKVVMEATPGYFYGGTHIAPVLAGLSDEMTVVVVLREPVARLESFFRFQKSMLTLPAELTPDDYVDRCLDLDPDDLATRRELNPWFGVEGGRYAAYLDPWIDTFGDRLRLLFFDDLAADMDAVVESLGTELGLDPAGWRGPSVRENRTIAPRHRSLHRAALGANRLLERQLRRHPAIKDRARRLYGRLNTTEATETLAPTTRARLEAHYAASNAAVAECLASREVGAHLPSWLG